MKTKEIKTKAEEHYETSSENPTDPGHSIYLNKKNLQPSDIPGLRFGYYGLGGYQNFPALIIPLRDIDGNLKSLQYIFKNQNGKFEKRFQKGADKEGCFLPFADLKECNKIYITEGVATAASLSKLLKRLYDGASEEDDWDEAFRNIPSVVCAFSALDIPKIGKILKEIYPNKEITCAADADQAGDKAAQECKTLGIQSIFPQRIEEKEGTDWGDVYLKLPLEEAVEELKRAVDTKVAAESQQALDIQKILEKIDEDPCKDFSMEHFPDVLRTYIESICETTEAHPIMITMSVLCSISAMVGKKAYLPKGEYFQNLYPNIWSLCITKSGGFKTTSLNKGSEIALQEDRKILQTIDDISKREDSNFDPLQGNSKKVDEKVEKEMLMESLKRPMLPTRTTTEFLIKHLSQGHQGMILSSEIGEWLGNMQKNHNVDLKQIFTYFYDVDIAPYEHRTKHCGNYIVKEPFVTINGVSTIDWIQNQVKAEDIFSGFFARMLLFAPPFENKVPNALPKTVQSSTKGIKAKAEIAQILNDLGEIKFSLTEKAKAYFKTIHTALYQMVRNSRYDERCQKFLEPYLKRWSPYVLKFAMLFRIIEDRSSNELSVSSIKAATEIVRVSMKSTAKLFERELGESEDQRKQRKVFEWIAKRIKQNKPTLLKNILDSKILDGGLREYQEILETLATAGKVKWLNPEIKNKKDWEYGLS